MCIIPCVCVSNKKTPVIHTEYNYLQMNAGETYGLGEISLPGHWTKVMVLCYKLQQIGDSPADSEEAAALPEESCVPRPTDDREAKSDPGQQPA